MSAIKDYVEKTVPRFVYLYEANYINRSKENPIDVFKTAKGELYSRLQGKHTQDDLNSLAKWFNDGRNFLLDEKNKELFKKVHNAIMKNLEDSFGFDPEELYDFDYSTGGVSLKNKKGSLSGANNIKRQKKVSTKNNKQSNEATFIRRVNNCYNSLEKIFKDASSQKDREKIEKGVAEIKKVMQVFKELLNNQKTMADAIKLLKQAGLANVSQKAAQEIIAIASETKKSQTSKRMDSRLMNFFIKILNGIMGQFRQEVLSNIRGEFLEYMFHAIKELANKRAENLSDSAIKEILEKAMKATGKKFLQMTVNVFGFKDDKKSGLSSLEGLEETLRALNAGVTLEGEGAKAMLKITNSSPQKSDFNITLNNEEFSLNIKNYASEGNPLFQKSIGLHSKTPLENLLFGADNIFRNLAYHYLNILATHEEDEGKHSGFKNAKEEGLSTLALTFLYQGFSGEMVGKSGGFADVFVWNDSKTGDIKFYDINFILSQLNTSSDLKNKISSPSLNKLVLNNKKVNLVDNMTMGEAISTRLNNVLQDMHQKKITISIPQSALKDIVNAGLTY